MFSNVQGYRLYSEAGKWGLDVSVHDDFSGSGFSCVDSDG